MLLVAKEDVRADFGVKLRAFRKEAGMTQKELGDKVGLHHQAIARIEAGTAPSWPNAVAIAEALGRSLDEFISEE